MHKILFLFGFSLGLFGCANNNGGNNTIAGSTEPQPDFFPVTSYLAGQVQEVKQIGIAPLVITDSAGSTDSVWLKFELLDSVFQDFLQPQIDTANLSEFFNQETFADQTLGTYTLNYLPKTALPDSISLMRWDVLINPETNKVKRVFIVRRIDDKTEQQLTWQSGLWAKKVLIANDEAGKQFVVKEQTIKWNFD